MRPIMIALSTACLIAATPAAAALKSGENAPDFTTKAAMAGKAFQFSLGTTLKKGPVVLYFYPAAFTSGCTIEANQFADATDDFKKMGATVIGVSADKIETLQKFSTTECRSKFAVAVASPTVIKAYDVKLSITGKSNRTSYVIAPDGKVIYAYSSLDYRGHVTNALAAVQQWHDAKHAKMGH
ncbi:MAG: peroxiredoxin [Chakrabartia sp.]